MRLAGVATVVALILGLTALDLTVGAVWAAGVAGAALLRRRHRVLPVVALAALGLAGWAMAREGLGEPPTRSYVDDPWRRTQAMLSPVESGPPGGAVAAQVSRRLAAVRREELAWPPADLARWAALIVAFSGDTPRLEGEASREAQRLHQAARRLALLLTAAEFRDLDSRRASLIAWLDAAAARLRAGDPEAVREAAQALEPAALAGVSLRPLYSTLMAAQGAIEGMLTALGGGRLVTAAELDVAVDDRKPVVETSLRRRLRLHGEGPLRLAWLEVLSAPGGGVVQVRGPGGVEAEAMAGRRLGLEPGSQDSTVTVLITGPAEVVPIRSALRRPTYRRVSVASASLEGVRVLAGVAVPGTGGRAVAPVAAASPPAPRWVVTVTAPPWSLVHVGWPGSLEPGSSGSRWTGTGPEGDGLEPLDVELAPGGWVFRNRLMGTLRRHLLGPSPAAILSILGLALLTVNLVPGRPPTVPTPKP